MKTNGYPTKGLLVLGLSFLVLLLTAGNCATPPLTPTIEHFRANPTIITSGEASTLSWSVRDATRITINQVVGDVSGKTSIAVSPTATTTYTLTAENGPSLATASVTVTVEAAEIADYVDEEGRRWTAIGPVRVDEVPTREELGLPSEDERREEDDALSLEELAENLRPVMIKDNIEYILAEPDLELARQIRATQDQLLIQLGSAAEDLNDSLVDNELSSALEPQKIIGSDDRTLRLNNTQVPWKAHVYISSNQGNCSGTMIGPRTILTSAHCVRSGSGAVKAGLTFRPGVNGGNGTNWAPYGRYRWSVPSGQPREVCALWWPSGYNSNSPVRYDYAVVRLCNNPGVNYWYGYGSFSGNALQGMSIWLFGYPLEEIPSYVQYPQIFGMGCSIRERYLRSIHYRCDTTGGQSGTGVYHIHNEYGRVIVGVHKGPYGLIRNRATRITSEVYNFIQSYGF